ncbi:MAG: hypothetical protein EGR72_00075 [Clostridiales bacterium]|nr:hypothetical protein [Clostridiales bacterium]
MPGRSGQPQNSGHRSGAAQPTLCRFAYLFDILCADNGNFRTLITVFRLNILLQQVCEQAQRQKILLYSSIPDELVRPMGMRSFSDMGALLKEADLAGKSIYVIPNGATVVPHIRKEAVL